MSDNGTARQRASRTQGDGLTKPSANVYDVQKALSSDFLERLAMLPPDRVAGLRLVLAL